jgi:hypothetical protein
MLSIAMNTPQIQPPFTVNTVKEIVHRLKIKQDTDAGNPRKEWDNLGTMYCEHRRYELGDKDAEDIAVYNYKTEQRETPLKGYTILPLFLYDHGGITMSTGRFDCPWDSGCVGYIYISDEKARKEYGWKVITRKRRELLATYLKNEVKTYDQYLTGEVFGFIYESFAILEDGTEESQDDEDSCWGFYGRDLTENGISDHLPVELKECEITWE